MKRNIGARFFFSVGKKRVRGEVVGWIGDISIIEYQDPNGEGTLWGYDEDLEKGFTDKRSEATLPAVKHTPAEEQPTMAKYSENSKIVVKVETNPKRAGSASAERFAQMQAAVAKGDTLAAVLGDTAYTSLDLAHDVKKGFVEVVTG